MKKLTQLAAAVALASSASVATAEISANVMLSTDYVWRGISQTQTNGAISGGFDYAHDSGFYAGVWASNVDFDDGGTSVEMDWYTGYGFNVTDDVSLDVGYIKYTYPDDGGLNFAEAYLNVGFYGFTVGYANSGTLISDDFSSDHWTVAYDTTLPGEVGLSVSYNLYDFKDPAFIDEEEYNYWSVGLSKSYLDLDWGLTYTDTDLSSDECASFAGDKDNCDAIFTLSVSKSL